MPIHCASANGNTEVVEILIYNGADIEAVDEVNNVHKLIVANITNI